MAALILKHHCATPESQVFVNLSSQTDSLSVGSGCTGTAACLVLIFYFIMLNVDINATDTKGMQSPSVFMFSSFGI